MLHVKPIASDLDMNMCSYCLSRYGALHIKTVLTVTVKIAIMLYNVVSIISTESP